jgi:succinate-acetate transporter protein
MKWDVTNNFYVEHFSFWAFESTILSKIPAEDGSENQELSGLFLIIWKVFTVYFCIKNYVQAPIDMYFMNIK